MSPVSRFHSPLLVAALCALVASCSDGGGGDGDVRDGGDPLLCGNGRVDPGETCDDGNLRAFDGCGPSCDEEFCGDGIAQLDEECDDGDAMAEVADVCRPGCIAPRCGDGIIDAFEACDDGNNDDGDGCAADCSVRVCRLGEDVATLAEAIDSRQCSPLIVPAGTFVGGGAVVTRSQVIVGEGQGASFLDGGGVEQVLRVELGAELELRDLTIRNGRAEQGGAIHNLGTLTLDGVTLESNIAEGPDGAPGEGGALYSRGPSTLTDCTVRGNLATGDGADPARGGGLYLLLTDTTLDGCTIADNEARGVGSTISDGGGIYLNRGTLTLTGETVIEGNAATSTSGLSGGGGFATARGTLTATGTIVRNNRVETGEIGVGGGIASNDGTITGSGLEIANNTINAPIMLGAGLHALSSELDLSGGTVISGNTLTAAGLPELARGGGLYLEEGPTTLRDVTVRDNRIDHAGEGGGLYIIATRSGQTDVDAEQLEVRGNAIAPTSAVRTTARGGGLYVRSGEGEAAATVRCTGCTILDNEVDVTTGGDGFAFGGGAFVEAVFGEATADLTFVDSRIAANRVSASGDEASADGAGVYVASTDDLSVATLTLDRTAVVANTAEASGASDAEAVGAGVFLYAVEGGARSVVRAVNSTIGGNTATAASDAPGVPETSIRAWGAGMALYAATGGTSDARIDYVTVADNRATATGGTAAGGAFHLYPVTDDANTGVTAAGSVVAGNAAATGPACHVQVGDDALTLASATLLQADDTCRVEGDGQRVSGGAELATTDGLWVPSATSAAIDRGEAACADADGEPLTVDQRGEQRPRGAGCDLGAIEVR